MVCWIWLVGFGRSGFDLAVVVVIVAVVVVVVSGVVDGWSRCKELS